MVDKSGESKWNSIFNNEDELTHTAGLNSLFKVQQRCLSFFYKMFMDHFTHTAVGPASAIASHSGSQRRYKTPVQKY